MSDIVERLREGCGCNFPETTCMAESECADAFEAADEITRLRAKVEDLGNRLHHVHHLWANNEHALRAEVEMLRAENDALRISIASLHNNINTEGSPYDVAMKAVEEMMLSIKRDARAALEEKP